ncbi:hypothetical protein BH11ARM1_BH11ARM1_02850 [soil metagenome]
MNLENLMGIMIPLGLVVVLPIVGIMTSHQRKVAEIFAQRSNQASDQEIGLLRQDIRELKELIHQQAIALDSTPRMTAPAPPPSVAERLNN